jgi:RNA polymerase sigma factor (sigma-70 family)
MGVDRSYRRLSSATLPAVDDGALARALARADLRGLAGAYRRYADRLYTYCGTLLPDVEAAAGAVHDTFVIAGRRAGQLREPDRLRAWLYAIARRECQRARRDRRRGVPGGHPSAELSSAEPAGPHVTQVRDLVRAAAAGLHADDRETVELTVRHGLSAVEAAAVLGLRPNHAHARTSQARARLLYALGLLLLARVGTADCAALARLLRGWDGVLTALVRKRVGRHVAGCPVCSARRLEHQSDPMLLLPAYAAMPFLPAPGWLWPMIESATGSGTGGGADGGYGADGFPLPHRSRLRPRSLAAVTFPLLQLPPQWR